MLTIQSIYTKQIATILICLCLMFPAFAHSETAQSIVATMQAKQKAREAGLGSYMVEQTAAGTRSLLYFEKDYNNGNLFRLIPPSEISTDKAMEKGWSPSHSKGMMLGMAAGSDLLRQGFKKELGLSTEDPLNVAMKGGIVGMLKMAAGLPTTEQYVNQKGKDAAAVKQEALDVQEFGSKADLIGSETLHGKDAFILKVSDLDRTQTTKDGSFTIQTASMWVDKGKYVPLRIRFEGIAKSDGESKPFMIENDSFDYKSEGPLYLPHTEIMRVSGVMNDQQKAEMKRAQKELQKLKTQLKGPQKEMILQMMGPQMKMLESLADGGGVEVVTKVREVTIPASRATYMAALVGAQAG